jgi:hypothetical protein
MVIQWQEGMALPAGEVSIPRPAPTPVVASKESRASGAMSKKMGSDRAVSKYLYRSLRYGSLGGYRQNMWWSGMFLIGVDDLGRSIETDYPV